MPKITSESCFLIGHRFMGLNPLHDLCQMPSQFCLSSLLYHFSFMPPLIRSHKIIFTITASRRGIITTPLPPVWGVDYGMEGDLHQSWAWGVLMDQSSNRCMGLNCSSFHTVASLSFHFLASCHYTSPKHKENTNEILKRGTVDCPLYSSRRRPKAGRI